MKKYIFIATLSLIIPVLLIVPDAFARTKATSSVNIENKVDTEGSSSVYVEQSVSSENKVHIFTYREKDGKILENRSRTISQAEDVDRDEIKQKIKENASKEVEKELEAANEEFETELKKIEDELEGELSKAEEEIAKEREEAAAELEEVEAEMGSVEEDLKEQWEEQLSEEELSFWERIRAWIQERIAQLRS